MSVPVCPKSLVPFLKFYAFVCLGVRLCVKALQSEESLSKKPPREIKAMQIELVWHVLYRFGLPARKGFVYLCVFVLELCPCSHLFSKAPRCVVILLITYAGEMKPNITLMMFKGHASFTEWSLQTLNKAHSWNPACCSTRRPAKFLLRSSTVSWQKARF